MADIVDTADIVETEDIAKMSDMAKISNMSDIADMTDIAETSGIRVIDGGMLTTVQDKGRYGYQASGIQVSGVMDQEAAFLANALVGNDELAEEAAVLETACLGPELEFQRDALAAVTGGMPEVRLDGRYVQPYTAFCVRAGQRLKIAVPRAGIRTYIAIAGGFAVAKVLGSRSTNLKLGLGGFMGRRLAAGDVLSVGCCSQYALRAMAGRAGLRVLPEKYVAGILNRGIFLDNAGKKIRQVRVVLGPQEDYFSRQAIAAFADSVYTVSNQSDRMGCRLQGMAVKKTRQEDMITDGIVFGSIQIPPDGQPIVMLADHQTTGGYPKLATVATVDLPLMAQAVPGDSLQFKIITVQEAQQLLRQQYEAMDEVVKKMKKYDVLPVPGVLDRQLRLKINGEVFDVIIGPRK